ncbi:DNA polymerase III subunit delta' [Novispirillum itersonii]|uniref:DNA polymerase-3 subunit delta n=1 Tax=Novispirillum itersonii TaxID=189 RepID=A0A7W9ZEH7_NOVIT|nr:DNA polymerase III subunit delta' [Novispirillum itersonii]MBB6210022.1 DNA polymerase-3 subunit delta' [Novispirillum itersonii]
MTDSGLLPPKENSLLLGHADAEHQVLDAWNAGRMHHAWLITGPRGIGKATFAYRVARFVLSQGDGPSGLFGPPDTLDIPPESPAFRQIAQGAHGDFRVVERQWDEKKKRFRGEIIVDSVRGVGEFLAMTAGGWKVVLVDAADEMNRNAANAILKVLEEPSKRSLLLLLAHNPARLLPTIRSRCRHLALRPPSEADALTLLARARPDLPRDDAEAMLRLSDGSIGRALELADEGGLQHYHAMITLLRSLPKLDGMALHAFADKVSRSEETFTITADLLQWWLARAIAAGGRRQEPVEIIPGENGLTRSLLAAAPLDRWVEVWEKIGHLFERTGAVALDKKTVLLSVFAQIEREMTRR